MNDVNYGVETARKEVLTVLRIAAVRRQEELRLFWIFFKFVMNTKSVLKFGFSVFRFSASQLLSNGAILVKASFFSKISV